MKKKDVALFILILMLFVLALTAYVGVVAYHKGLEDAKTEVITRVVVECEPEADMTSQINQELSIKWVF